jgi:sodium-dependent dicarboxylate transporter 2/3/5
MMYPIALGILSTFNSEKKENSSFGLVLLLASAYASSIGGIATPVGSPPNLIAIGMLEKLASFKITFFQWMLIGLLVLIPMYFALFLILKFRLRKEKDSKETQTTFSPENEKAQKGLTRPQQNVLIAFCVTVALWILPGLVSIILGRDSSLSLWLEKHFPESVVAIIGAGLLFILPVDLKRGQFTLPLKEALKVDWGTLLLFGGGLSLGMQMFETGLADAMGRFFISSGGSSASLSLITLVSVVFSVCLTEVASNTAAANMIIPVVIAISKAASVNPLPPVIGSAIGCSFAFMLPVSTPPNAIIYGSGLVSLTKMVNYGFWLEITGIIIIWVCVRFVAPFLGLI